MMMETIGNFLPMSIGIALSPLPILTVIIMLMTARAKTNGSAFLIGWSLGIFTVGVVVLLLPGMDAWHGEPTKTAGLIRIILGAVFLILAVHQWLRRSTSDGPPEVPKLLIHLDNFGVFQTSFTGFMLSGLNLKNMALSAAGAAAIIASDIDPGARMVALILFTAISSLTVAVPVGVYFLSRHRAEPILDRWKVWLIRNRVTVLIAVLLVLGILLISDGLKILAA